MEIFNIDLFALTERRVLYEFSCCYMYYYTIYMSILLCSCMHNCELLLTEIEESNFGIVAMVSYQVPV